MRCDQAAVLLPGYVDGTVDVPPELEVHLASCLRCQAELARYRRLLRTLRQLRSQFFEPTPGLLGDTLTALGDAAERSLARTIFTGRHLAYAGAAAGAAAFAGAAVVIIARSRRGAAAA